MTKQLLLIGVGAGDPDQITIQAIKAMNRVDVFFLIDKGETRRELLDARRDICKRHVTDRTFHIVEVADPERDRNASSYRQAVDAWHDRRAAVYQQAIDDELRDGQIGAFLVWGDPSLYDSTLRIIERLAADDDARIDYEVIPGITSVQALAAKHRIPITSVAGSTVITTGRNLATQAADGIHDTVVVMLDGSCAFLELPESDVEIYWGANLGAEGEALIAGRVTEVGEGIEETRHRVKREHGWVMDTYVLRPARPSA